MHFLYSRSAAPDCPDCRRHIGFSCFSDNGVTLDTLPHIQMIEAKALRTFIRIYSLFKSERLSANIKLTLHKAIIRSVMTYACPAWEFAAVSHLLKLQRPQNRVLRTIGSFLRRTSVRDMHVAFQIPYVYDYITKSCRQQAEVIQNHENENVRSIGQGEA
jgi:hypothetical protein